MFGVNENDNSLCASSISENDSENSGVLSTTTSDPVNDSSLSDTDYLSNIYEVQVQTLVMIFAMFVLILIGGLTRLMNKFFE